MRRYVAGALIWTGHDSLSQKVLLVSKTHPRWQSGLLNFIGGGVEDGETSDAAMRREFAEEAGLDLDWDLFCTERGSDYVVSFYRHTLPESGQMPVVSEANDVGERLAWYSIYRLLDDASIEMVGNLNWLIPMALDWRKLYASVDSVDDISSNPCW